MENKRGRPRLHPDHVKTQLERQNDYFAGQQAKGLHQVRVWVPVEKIDEIKTYARWLCHEQG